MRSQQLAVASGNTTNIDEPRVRAVFHFFPIPGCERNDVAVEGV